jgi:hypothetical protein
LRINALRALCKAISSQGTAVVVMGLEEIIKVSRASSASARNAEELDTKRRKESHVKSLNLRGTSITATIRARTISMDSTLTLVEVIVDAAGAAPGPGPIDQMRTYIDRTSMKFKFKFTHIAIEKYQILIMTLL